MTRITNTPDAVEAERQAAIYEWLETLGEQIAQHAAPIMYQGNGYPYAAALNAVALGIQRASGVDLKAIDTRGGAL